MRILIVGAPGTGKTTMARTMGNSRSTDDVMHLGWSESSLEVSRWLDSPGPWVIEGVAVPRAIRKWIANNPDKPLPVDRIVHMQTLYRAPTKGQMAMGKGIDTVLAEIAPYLKNIPVTYL